MARPLAQVTDGPLPATTHFKPSGKRTVEPQAIQQACKEDEGVINAVAEEEKELPQNLADQRDDWAGDQLKEHPHSINWKDVYFCD